MFRYLPCGAIAVLALVLTGADWKQFRGPSSSSAATHDVQLPLKWNTARKENVAWRADLPGRGPSGPIVVGDQVIVTCSSGYQQDRLHVLSFDTKTGTKQWERQFWATGRTRTHPSSANAAPTPASDGRHVFAFFSSNDLICLDLDGDLKWFRGLAYDFPKAGNDIGMASSPITAADTVIVQIENQGDSFVAGIDTENGHTRWRLVRPKRANWSSPIVMNDADGQPIVLLKSGEGLVAYDVVTGERRWLYQSDAGGVESAVAVGDKVYLPANGLTVLQIKGGNQAPEIAWSSSQVRPSSASPIIHQNQVFAMNGAGVLTCADLDAEQVKWKLRLKGKFWATPVLANGYLYCINEQGSAQVVSVGDKGEIVATSEFGETIQGSPAVADDAMYVRSDKSLWKISSR